MREEIGKRMDRKPLTEHLWDGSHVLPEHARRVVHGPSRRADRQSGAWHEALSDVVRCFEASVMVYTSRSDGTHVTAWWRLWYFPRDEQKSEKVRWSDREPT